MKAARGYIAMAFRSAFAYKSSVFFLFFGSVISILAQIALWNFLYAADPAKRTYMTAYVVLSTVINFFYYGNVAKYVEAKVRSGDLAVDLLRPVNPITVFWSIALGNILSSLALRGLPILLVFSYAFFGQGITLWKLCLFLLALLAGHVLFTLIYICLGYLAFVTFAIWPFFRLVNDTIRFLSGSVIPLTLFPPFLQTLSWFTPFRFLYTFPIDLLIGSLPAGEILLNFTVMAVWILAFAGLLALASRQAEKRLVVQGG